MGGEIKGKEKVGGGKEQFKTNGKDNERRNMSRRGKKGKERRMINMRQLVFITFLCAEG